VCSRGTRGRYTASARLERFYVKVALMLFSWLISPLVGRLVGISVVSLGLCVFSLREICFFILNFLHYKFVY
jgi:hypothetical protein